ncbi:hypothetical protein [Microbacterium hominis]|uniref:hypothetical protein n=1 Tax=Microbacterium hominis TaxID=162426 RepID=UPI000768728B|nr:hypothetical protein [Microbacterium hominis]KXC06628.1 hypothetical protein MhomT_04275 [Microbacterium hominis]
MRVQRTGRVRALLAVGAVFAASGFLTAAALSDSAEVVVTMDASRNGFDLMTAGSALSGWQPEATDWAQGRPDSYQIALDGPDGGGYPLAPGGSISLRVAVLNASPRLTGAVSLAIDDPFPRGNEIDPDTGRFVELFDQLVFTVSHDGVVVLDGVPAPELPSTVWAGEIASGQSETFDVVIHLPDTVDDRWQQASTDIRFHFAGENR